uniref:Uncharacterized protein n=1 Tax=Ralstonia syzygii R24 TaxID=907261 RepID=G3A757_9RALS|nr:hypothetical protein RALSY_40538 [Ralstonia syzygii R24]
MEGMDGVNLDISYDKVGNKLRQTTTYNTESQRTVADYGQVLQTDESGNPVLDDAGNPVYNTVQIGSHTVYDATAHTQDQWFAYDAMNRHAPHGGGAVGAGRHRHRTVRGAHPREQGAHAAAGRAGAVLGAAVPGPRPPATRLEPDRAHAVAGPGGAADERGVALHGGGAVRGACRAGQARWLPPVPAFHGDADAGERRGHPLHPGDARARGAVDHTDLHAGGHPAVAAGACGHASRGQAAPGRRRCGGWRHSAGPGSAVAGAGGRGRRGGWWLGGAVAPVPRHVYLYLGIIASCQ